MTWEARGRAKVSHFLLANSTDRTNKKKTALEFLNNLWGLGTESE